MQLLIKPALCDGNVMVLAPVIVTNVMTSAEQVHGDSSQLSGKKIGVAFCCFCTCLSPVLAKQCDGNVMVSTGQNNNVATSDKLPDRTVLLLIVV